MINRRSSACLSLLLATTLLVAPPAYTATASSSTSNSARATKAELAATLEELNALKIWLSDAEKKRALWQQEIQSADREVARLGLKVAALQSAVQEVKDSQSELAREALTLDEKRKTEGKRIAEHLNAAYRMSGQDFFKLLLNQESPEQFDRMIRYHQYFSAERGKILKNYRATLTALELNQSKAATAAAKLASQQTAAAEEQQVFVAQQTVRKKLIAKLYASVRSKEAQQQQLREDSLRLRKLLRTLAKQSQQTAGQEFAARKGKLAWPTEGRLQNGFGESRADGRLKWQGSYIVTAPGASIRSVHRGKVIFAEWLRGFGLLTIIDHGNGYLSLYGYADVLMKEPGDRVESGEQIASSGRSGGQDADGLYFEIRKDGNPINPSQWLFTSATE